MVQDIELDEEKFVFEEKDEVHAIASVLKQCRCSFRLISAPYAQQTSDLADLRELPEPVFNLPHAERIKYTESRGRSLSISFGFRLHGALSDGREEDRVTHGPEANISNNFANLRARLRRLPPIHQTTFQAIIEHLGRVQSRSSSNKMDAKVSVWHLLRRAFKLTVRTSPSSSTLSSLARTRSRSMGTRCPCITAKIRFLRIL